MVGTVYIPIHNFDLLSIWKNKIVASRAVLPKMPAKSKNQVNGFWLFAQKTKPTWKAQGMKINTNDQLLAIAAPLWKVRVERTRFGFPEFRSCVKVEIRPSWAPVPNKSTVSVDVKQHSTILASLVHF